MSVCVCVLWTTLHGHVDKDLSVVIRSSTTLYIQLLESLCTYMPYMYVCMCVGDRIYGNENNSDFREFHVKYPTSSVLSILYESPQNTLGKGTVSTSLSPSVTPSSPSPPHHTTCPWLTISTTNANMKHFQVTRGCVCMLFSCFNWVDFSRN